MINEKIRNFIKREYPDAILFDNPSFDESIIGLQIDGKGQVVYDYDKMILELMGEDDISREEAMSFIDYNTLRTLPYIEKSIRPIIVDYTDIMRDCK